VNDAQVFSKNKSNLEPQILSFDSTLGKQKIIEIEKNHHVKKISLSLFLIIVVPPPPTPASLPISRSQGIQQNTRSQLADRKLRLKGRKYFFASF
jgi:hypothetical protein